MKMKNVDFFCNLNSIFTHQRNTIAKSRVPKYQVLMLPISEDINSFLARNMPVIRKTLFTFDRKIITDGGMYSVISQNVSQKVSLDSLGAMLQKNVVWLQKIYQSYI